MYKLEVVGIHPEMWNHPCWNNFCDYLDNGSHLTADEWHRRLDIELAKFNCINEVHTNFLIFETEADATNFVLRWS